MKKGFTLIELLAVIVILAIIALIATPIILNIINDAKNESDKRSKELYLHAVNQAIARKNLTEEFNPTSCTVNKDGNLTCDGEELIVEVNGKKPCKGTITLENMDIVSEDIGYCDGSTDDEVQGDEGYYTDSSGANTPDLMDGTLTPVVYDNNSKKWKIADPNDEWYDYSKQNWANAVILKSELRSTKKVGDELTLPTTNNDFNSSDVLAMFVWIPRYSYTIKNQYGDGGTSATSPGAIDIKFVGVDINDSGTATYTDEKNKESSWYTHPAFTFGDKNLSGIWVGKFETSHTTYSSTTTSNQLNCTNESCEGADNIRILPNVQSLRYQTVAPYFYVVRSMSRNNNLFGINSNTTDTHMMKNSEWGAVAYLSQSKYGKYGNDDYTGVNKEIYQNKSSDYITGSSNGTPSQKETNTQCAYDEEGESRAEGTGSCGGGASTTGNIYGIYDMNGGAWEYVMGNYNNTVGSFQSDFFNTENNKKYYDKYTITSTSSCTKGECKGHALSETSGWYSDSVYLVSSSNPWFVRGGNCYGTGSAGVFGFSSSYGGSSDSNSFRVVFAPTTISK